MNNNIFDKYPFPHPYDVKTKIDQGMRLSFDLHDELDLIFPTQALKKKYNVLIVGCGHNEAIYHSIRNPMFKFTAIDISSSVIDSNLKQIKDNNIKNLKVHKIDLFDFSDNEFDIIIIMDFISYHKNPTQVLSHISSLLSNDGAILANVLSTSYFQQVNIISEVLLDLGYSFESDEDIAEAFDFVKKLDNLHPSRIALLDFIRGQVDPNSFIDIRDFAIRYLNVSAHYYSVNKLFELFKISNVFFQGWYSNSLYYPSANIKQNFIPSFVERLNKKSLQEQWNNVCNINSPYSGHLKHLFCLSKNESNLFLQQELMKDNKTILNTRKFQSYKKSQGVGSSFILSANRKMMLSNDEDTIYRLLESPRSIDYILNSDEIDLGKEKRELIINNFFESSVIFPTSK
tara:strand:- start:548 stop:1750 length:1203 start_codon:yes stop_codon:yes gene_type:complete